MTTCETCALEFEGKARVQLPALWWFWLSCFVQNMAFAGAAFFAWHAKRWLWF